MMRCFVGGWVRLTPSLKRAPRPPPLLIIEFYPRFALRGTRLAMSLWGSSQSSRRFVLFT